MPGPISSTLISSFSTSTSKFSYYPGENSMEEQNFEVDVENKDINGDDIGPGM